MKLNFIEKNLLLKFFFYCFLKKLYALFFIKFVIYIFIEKTLKFKYCLIAYIKIYNINQCYK